MDGSIDIERLTGELGDVESALSFTGRYLGSLGGRMDAIEYALARGDAALVHREAHAIKGGALSIMAGELRLCAEALELEAKKAILARGAERLAAIRAAFAATTAYYERWKGRTHENHTDTAGGG